MTQTEAQLELLFVDIAQKRSELLRSGNPKKANREYDRLHDLKDQMRELPDRGEAAFKRISNSEDIELRILAAAALFAVDEPYAINLLETIAANDLGNKSFEANMTLKEWRKGAMRDYWG